MAQRTYSFLDTHCAIVGFGGAFDMTASAAEEGITINMRDDKGVLTIGADGNGMHSLRADDSGEISIALLKNSPVNFLLSAMYNAQKRSPQNWGQNTITLVSGVGDVVTMTGVGFKRQSGLSYAVVGGTNVWEFVAISVNEVLAGSI